MIEPFGDAAALIRIDDGAGPELAVRAQEIAAAVERLRGTELPALGRPIPALASVLVPFDPLAIAFDEVAAALEPAVASARHDPSPAAVEAEPLEIPVHYGGPDGRDLADVAERTGLTPGQVVELHASTSFRVLFLGFAPGFGYLAGLPAQLVLPRRATPRERVPAGSVAIAGAQTGVYPRSMPGGWHLLGRTDAVLFDPRRDPPTPLTPGRPVRFVPIGA